MKILTILLFLIFHCADIDGIQTRKETKEKTDLFVLTLTQNRSKGNCLRKDFSTNTAYCDRRSAGLCNPSHLILTNSEKGYNLTEGNNIVKEFPTCSYSFSNAGFFFEPVADFVEQDKIWANNKYASVDSCEVLGLNSSLLITESEYLFTISPKGRIAISADKIKNTSDSLLLVTLRTMNNVRKVKSDALNCLETGFSQLERDLISDLRTSKRVKEITCSIEIGSSTACPF